MFGSWEHAEVLKVMNWNLVVIHSAICKSMTLSRHKEIALRW